MTTDTHGEKRLAELLDDLLDRQAAGEFVDIEAVCNESPELAPDLRELWGAVMVADAVAGFEDSLSDVEGPTDDELEAVELPRAFGDYNLVEELGRGGMGVVYRGRQSSLDRTVAIKMISRGRLASSEDLARFRAEAEATAKLDHPAIVPVYEVGEHAGQPYFSMKYIAGETLSDRLADGPLPPREAARLLSRVARAIEFAHARGILHRDLKPANILIDADGQPHITDFGLAKRIDADVDLTTSGAILGTPMYMAPEQAAGTRGELSPATDVYSLGSILYQMLTGRPPFQAATPVDTILLLLEQDPPPPHVLNPKVDRDLEMIALRCLQKPAELRYASAAALADDLDRFVRDEPVSARSAGIVDVMARVFRETHHAPVLENWGLLWMWHSLVLLVLCLVTNVMKFQQITSAAPYVALWTCGLLVWSPIFWALRHRAGPVTFVERQIAHVWGASIVAIIGLFIAEILLGLPVLTLSPVLGLISGMVFTVKAGILGGQFYVQAVALYASAIPMAMFPAYGPAIFGVVSWACFFVPGLKYWRQAKKSHSGTRP
ncbi:MAG: serine/threonine protein kinase [Pirellulales bacterium]|nr:serine/threonine protein kinase [Pirellulales bacterium]